MPRLLFMVVAVILMMNTAAVAIWKLKTFFHFFYLLFLYEKLMIVLMKFNCRKSFIVFFNVRLISKVNDASGVYHVVEQSSVW